MAGINKADLSVFNKRMQEIYNKVPHDAEVVTRNEARLLLEAILKKVKPKPGKLSKSIERTMIFDEPKQKYGAFIPSKTGGQSQVNKRLLYRFRKGEKITRPVVQKAVLDNAVKVAKLHIGWFAASFLCGGNPLKAQNVTANITRHKGQGSTVIRKGPLGFQIKVTNNANFAAHYPRFIAKVDAIINAALKGRAKQMEGNLRRIVSGKSEYRPL
jgi:hypothetical protein